MRILLIIFLVISFSFVIYPQQIFDSDSVVYKQTTKVDEFGDPIKNECDRGARLDMYAFALQNSPDTRGNIIIYLGADEPLVEQLERKFQYYAALLKIYLTVNRGIDKSRLNFIYGGFRPELTTELWIVPENGETPKPTNTVPKPIIPNDVVSLYSKSYLPNPYEDLEPYDLLLPAVKVELGSDGRKQFLEDQKRSKQEREELKFSWANVDFGNTIKQQANSNGLIIFYFDETRLDKKKVSKRIEEGKLRIAREAGISTARIKTVFGGYRDFVQAELWLVPQNVAEPKPQPESKETAEN